MGNSIKRLYQEPDEVWLSDELKTILTNAPENGVFIDAGCHVGVWNKYLNKIMPKKFISIGIDPIDHNVGTYDHFFNYSIDVIEGIRDLHIFKESACNSLFKSSKEIDDLSLSWMEEIGTIKTETRTLESLLKKSNIDEIYFLKCDCQGNDVNVVKSLKSYINKVQYIQIESNLDKKLSSYNCGGSFEEDIIEIEKLGFKAMYYVIWELDGLPAIECDILFRKNKLPRSRADEVLKQSSIRSKLRGTNP
ncbi:MAG TPA: hypothetical protein ENH82_16555 [bacterium]|nr:hypothetical protein [bacterium]